MTRLPRTLLLAAAASLALSACATSTAYAPQGYNGQRGGYAEQRLEQDRYRVSFAGNSVTSRDQVEMSLLLRAAELTVENGYDWFETVNRSTDRDTRYQTIGDPFFNRYSPFWGPSWRYYGPLGWSRWNDPFWGRDDFDVRQIDRYEATAEIVMGRGEKPRGEENAFDAREVVANLGGRVTRPM